MTVLKILAVAVAAALIWQGGQTNRLIEACQETRSEAECLLVYAGR